MSTCSTGQTVNTQRMHYNAHTTTLFNMPEKDSVCPNTYYVKSICQKCLLLSVAFCSMQASMLFWLFWPTILCSDIWARGSKFKCYDKVVCPSCMHTACNSTYFVRTAAVHMKSKKKKYAIWNAAVILDQLWETQKHVAEFNTRLGCVYVYCASLPKLYYVSLLNCTTFLYWTALRFFTELYYVSFLNCITFLYQTVLFLYPTVLCCFTELYCLSLPNRTVCVLNCTAFLYRTVLCLSTELHCISLLNCTVSVLNCTVFLYRIVLCFYTELHYISLLNCTTFLLRFWPPLYIYIYINM